MNQRCFLNSCSVLFLTVSSMLFLLILGSSSCAAQSSSARSDGRFITVHKGLYTDYPAAFVSFDKNYAIGIDMESKSIDADIWVEPRDPEVKGLQSTFEGMQHVGEDVKVAFLSAREFDAVSSIPLGTSWKDGLKSREIRSGTVFLVRSSSGCIYKVLINSFSEDGTIVFKYTKLATPTTVPTSRKTLTNSIRMKLVYIPAGEFMMGSRDSVEEVGHKSGDKNTYFTHEHPQHRVKITNGFFMGSTEVTQGQYREIMGQNPSHFKGVDNPVERISWNDAVKFCKKLSEKEGKTYRLPTEAEWEYACRAGTTTPFYTGETISTSQANYNGDFVYGSGTKGVYRKRTIAVGSFPRNAFGLYDMYGNVWEWCQDWHGKGYYETSPTTDPQGPSTGVYRLLRGASWNICPWNCRSASRYWNAPFARYDYFGFRILLELN